MPSWKTPGQAFYRRSPEQTVSKRADQMAKSLTIDRMTTQGRFNLLTIALDKVDLPEPELPAMPMILTSAQGGE